MTDLGIIFIVFWERNNSLLSKSCLVWAKFFDAILGFHQPDSTESHHFRDIFWFVVSFASFYIMSTCIWCPILTSYTSRHQLSLADFPIWLLNVGDITTYQFWVSKWKMVDQWFHVLKNTSLFGRMVPIDSRIFSCGYLNHQLISPFLGWYPWIKRAYFLWHCRISGLLSIVEERRRQGTCWQG